MYKKYDITSNIKNIQNKLVTESIREHSNVQLLNSEEAIRNVLASYSDKINSTGEKLTNISKHLVKSKELITKEQFNRLFDSLYIDLKTLYTNLDYLDEILALNLARNKKFFNVIKKRLKELWNKLILTRLNINDSSTFDESYFESFSNMANRHKYSGVLINKKNGLMTLIPKKVEIQNKKYQIKKIQTYTIPVHNKDGGVIHTASALNQFESSYKRDGNKDMLQNGLWKTQILSNDIPELKFDITSSDSDSDKIYMSTTGIVSIVDIYYVYPVSINHIDFDFFGDYPINILNILAWNNDGAGSWVQIEKKINKQQSTNYVYVDDMKQQTGYDYMSIHNLESFETKALRVIFNQQNYDLLDTSTITTENLNDKINEDFLERRYEVVKLDGGSDDKPAIPKSFNNEALYSEILDVIDNTRSLEEMLKKTIQILEPQPKLEVIDFKKTLKYELGTWSIEPMLQKYSGIGKFNSGKYTINDRSLISVSLTTKQIDIEENTCNWFISNPISKLNIPIIENKKTIRKEPAHILNHEYYNNRNWNIGRIIHLDFPINLDLVDTTTYIYENGIKFDLSDYNYKVINSTLIYINNITDEKKNNYVIQYIPDIYNSMYVYVLEKITDYDDDNPLEFEVVSTKKSILKYFINKIDRVNEFNIKVSRCTSTEYKKLFPNNETLCMNQNSWNIYKNVIGDALTVNRIRLFITQEYDSIDFNQSVNEIFIGSYITPGIPVRIERNIN